MTEGHARSGDTTGLDPWSFTITGGTLYNPITEKPEPHEVSVIPAYLENIIKPHKDLSFETLFMKDSLEITSKDRQAIARAIQVSAASRIVVTHGTSTLEETARYLEEAMVGGDKVIVIMGAMIPLKEFPMSDAGFNLGFALGAIESLEAGVHVCMNAQIFEPQNVTKNVEIGRFTYKGAFNLHAH